MRELPFDSVRKRMARVYEEDSGSHVYVEGAPEVVLERSTMPADESASIEAVAEEWASRGLKVLAVAKRELPAAQVEDDALELGLTLIGLVGLHDPLRESAREAVEEARAAGLRWR